MEDGGLCNPPDPKKEKLEKQTEEEDSEYETEEEKDNRKLYSLDDLKEIRKKIQNHIDYWKGLSYEKRTEDPLNFTYFVELQRIPEDYFYHNSLATSNTSDILVEFNLFKKVIGELVKDSRAFDKYLKETYDREWRLNLGKLYKLGMDNVVNKMREDISVRKLDRSYLLGFIDDDLIPTLEKMDLGDIKDDEYEDLAKMLDKQYKGKRCSRKFLAEEFNLALIGKSIIRCMGEILQMRGDQDTTLGVGATTAANMHVDCLT